MSSVKSGVPLVQKWQIKDKDIEPSVQNIMYMMMVLKDKENNFESIDQLYGQWELIADRLKRGKEYVDDENYERHEEAVGQYQFLLTMLGIYDVFFKRILAERPYKALQNNILKIVNF